MNGVNVKFLSKNLPFSSKKSKFITEILLQAANLSKYNLTLSLCDNKYMKRANFEDRQKNEETDVLSYPLLDFTKPGHVIDDIHMHLGEILVSIEYLEKQVEENETFMYYHFPKIVFL